MEPPRLTSDADRPIKLLGRARALHFASALLSFAVFVITLLETLSFSQPTAVRVLTLLIAFCTGFACSGSPLSAVLAIPLQKSIYTFITSRRPD